MERWKLVNTQKDNCACTEDGPEIGSEKSDKKIKSGAGNQLLAENGLSSCNGGLEIHPDTSCRPKCGNNHADKSKPNLNAVVKQSVDQLLNGHHNGFNSAHCGDCLESQYPFISSINSKCFCSGCAYRSSPPSSHSSESCNINSNMCHTVVCDGMESYFNENSVIIDHHSDKLTNGESSEQNNLNSAADSAGDTNCDDNHRTFTKNESESSRESVNIVCVNGESSAACHNAVHLEMDAIEVDFEVAQNNDENTNGFIDSDIGSDSRGSSPQPSSYDSGNDNEEVNLDCLTESNSNNGDGDNDLGNNLHDNEQENNFQNQLSPNIVNKPSSTSDSLVQNVFTDEHSLCSDDSDHVNMEICEPKANHEGSSFNIQSEDMDFENLNFHSTLCQVEKFSNKDNLFCSKPICRNLMKEMELGKCEENIMIWSEREACNLQVSQVATSACGATAVINTLVALKVPFTKENVIATVKTRLRAENASLDEYLLSRSNAGTTHKDLISALHQITAGKVYGRFFHLYPAKRVQLMQWIADFIKIGAVPIVTLNLQQGVAPGDMIPDAWHHQMVFGVGPAGLYLTNPLSCVPSSVLSKQLCSESDLLVRRSDVISRWDDNQCDLSSIMFNSDPRWLRKNVIGQVVNILREAAAAPSFNHRRTVTHHISIPAAYQSGISFFIRKDSEGYRHLLHYPDLS